MASSRRRARTVALQALYEFDCVGHEPYACVSRIAQQASFPKAVTAFAEELVKGVVDNREDLDAIIHRFAPSFPVDQLSAVDRNVLRLAIFEIKIEGKVPVKAVINEAVELAKTFGSDSSSRFINGVLGSVSGIVLHG
ncbi:MAG: transcription antitermination factor NusB [Dehalococcoidia bacterium]